MMGFRFEFTGAAAKRQFSFASLSWLFLCVLCENVS